MTGRFRDKVVFVTGGTSGLGAQTCELFLSEGAIVFVTDLQVLFHTVFRYSGSIWIRLTPRLSNSHPDSGCWQAADET